MRSIEYLMRKPRMSHCMIINNYNIQSQNSTRHRKHILNARVPTPFDRTTPVSSPSPQSSLRCPDTLCSSSSVAGPSPQTVRLPAAICVRPASANQTNASVIRRGSGFWNTGKMGSDVWGKWGLTYGENGSCENVTCNQRMDHAGILCGGGDGEEIVLGVAFDHHLGTTVRLLGGMGRKAFVCRDALVWQRWLRLDRASWLPVCARICVGLERGARPTPRSSLAPPPARFARNAPPRDSTARPPSPCPS